MTRRWNRIPLKRDFLDARAKNSGIFICLPDPEKRLDEWEVELEGKMEHARKVLREFRELMRAGKPLPDFEAEAREKAERVLGEFLGKLDEADRRKGAG